MFLFSIGLALGFLIATCIFLIRDVLRQQKREQRKRAQRSARKAAERAKDAQESIPLPIQAASLLSEAVPPTENPVREPLPDPAVKPAPAVKTTADPQPVTPQREESKQERLQRLYRGFAPVENLGLEFQYTFPDTILFQPGTGYLRNEKNQLIPEQKIFSSTNSAMGYAMEGLFRIFNVVYQGRTFTFRQVMDGEMGNSYVQVHRILAPVLITPTGHFGSYNLEKLGTLEVIDLQ